MAGFLWFKTIFATGVIATASEGDIVLQMDSADGLSRAQLGLIKPEDRLAAVMADFEVKFAYGARAH